ncbi:YaiI/YqxD family protein [uncultured Enterococcus sp.]|uniref:YaiI/YqxD family protein n=1 Tax=uncultured Enterococcus sp. TaxID=167972 RepID=UPI0025D49F2F|nr:YaiI/YqxD family protein [uncultured Enterococcus sp.]
MRLVIDGDGSPVKEEVIQVAKQFNLPVLIVTSIAHFTTKEYPDFVTLVYVEKGHDRADYEIVKLVKASDWVITQDYGLASLLLPKGVRVFHQSGVEYQKETIDLLLLRRFEHAELRKQKKRVKGPKPFTHEDRKHFLQVLTQELTQYFNKMD